MTKHKDLDRYDGRRPAPRNAKGKPHGKWNGKRTRTTKPATPGRSRIAVATFSPNTFERLVWLSEAQNVPLAQIIRDACDSYVHVIVSKIDAVQVARLRAAKTGEAR